MAEKSVFSSMHFPGLPEDAKIRKVIFLRRKPLGFTTGVRFPFIRRCSSTALVPL